VHFESINIRVNIIFSTLHSHSQIVNHNKAIGIIEKENRVELKLERNSLLKVKTRKSQDACAPWRGRNDEEGIWDSPLPSHNFTISTCAYCYNKPGRTSVNILLHIEKGYNFLSTELKVTVFPNKFFKPRIR
jgi:hypothetical protein